MLSFLYSVLRYDPSIFLCRPLLRGDALIRFAACRLSLPGVFSTAAFPARESAVSLPVTTPLCPGAHRIVSIVLFVDLQYLFCGFDCHVLTHKVQ